MNALKSGAFAAYTERWADYLLLCNRFREQADHVLLRELVRSFGNHYAERKRQRSGLDFDDLEVIARDLLLADEGIRNRYRERFSHVMVDEFQDTNPLQNELLGLVENDNLFRVGDERPVDLPLPPRRREPLPEAPRRGGAGRPRRADRRELPQPEPILDAVDLVFESLWGDDYEPLRAPR